MNRRQFISRTAVSLAAMPAAVSATSWIASSGGRVVTQSEAATLDALCARIIPADQHPGASWAGAVLFIDRKLAGYRREDQALYRSGLEAINRASQALNGRPFGALTEEHRDALLLRLERGQLPESRLSDSAQKGFFNRLADDTMQSFYGGPRHGGNRDSVSWRMLGLPQPPVRSRRPTDAPWAKGKGGA